MSAPLRPTALCSAHFCLADSEGPSHGLSCSITNLITETKHTRVYRGRKKLTLDFYVVKSVSLTQKERAINEVQCVCPCALNTQTHALHRAVCRGARCTSCAMTGSCASRSGALTGQPSSSPRLPAECAHEQVPHEKEHLDGPRVLPGRRPAHGAGTGPAPTGGQRAQPGH